MTSEVMILGPEGRVTFQTRRTIYQVTREAGKTPGLPRKNIPEIWGGEGGGKGNGETADTPNPSLRHPEELPTSVSC